MYYQNYFAKDNKMLGQFMLDLHTGEHGYTEVNPPILVHDDAMFGTAQLPKLREDQFLATQIKAGNLGGRIGLTWVAAPYRSSEHPRFNPVLHRIVVNTELGSKPVDGMYIKFGVAWGLLYR